jgi:beta-galactosidase
MKEVPAAWGFPDELKSWTWPGQEGKKINVSVYTRSKKVILELNGELVAEQTVPDTSISATFEIKYQPGTLVAKTFDDERLTGADTLKTTRKPVAIRLIADRKTINASPDDLSYISAEIIDEDGNVVPNVDNEITYAITGNATLAAVGNGNYEDATSFQQHIKKVFHGKGLAIIRPTGSKGTAILKATAVGLKGGLIEIVVK